MPQHPFLLEMPWGRQMSKKRMIVTSGGFILIFGKTDTIL